MLAPCAIERAIDGELARRLRRRIAEGANGPTTPKPTESSPTATTEYSSAATSPATWGRVVAEVISESVQDLQQLFWSKDEVTDRPEWALDRSWTMVVNRARWDGVANRTAAMAIGVERVMKAKQGPGRFP